MSFNNQQQKLSPDKHMEEMKSQIKNFGDLIVTSIENH